MANQTRREYSRELSGKLALQMKDFDEIVSEEVQNGPTTKSEEKHITETSLQKFLQLLTTFTTACKIFPCFYKEWNDTRQKNIKNLTSMTDDLENTTHKANISRVAGSTAGIAAAVLTITGLITMPFTRKCNNYTCSLFVWGR